MFATICRGHWMLTVRDYLLADRQWKRDHRIAHAKRMLALVTTPKEKQFWRDVLDANYED